MLINLWYDFYAFRVDHAGEFGADRIYAGNCWSEDEDEQTDGQR